MRLVARTTRRIRDLSHPSEAAVIPLVGIGVGKIEVRLQLEEWKDYPAGSFFFLELIVAEKKKIQPWLPLAIHQTISKTRTVTSQTRAHNLNHKATQLDMQSCLVLPIVCRLQASCNPFERKRRRVCFTGRDRPLNFRAVSVKTGMSSVSHCPAARSQKRLR